MDAMIEAANLVSDAVATARRGTGAAWLSYYYFTARAETD
jgi:hypothetical protein